MDCRKMRSCNKIRVYRGNQKQRAYPRITMSKKTQHLQCHRVGDDGFGGRGRKRKATLVQIESTGKQICPSREK